MCRPLSLLSAGSNARGQLATGDTNDSHRFTPCHFDGASPGSLPEHVVAIQQIACGANHTLALLLGEGGRTELWGCGDGSRGQLGPGYAGEPEAAVLRPLDLRLGEIDISSPLEEYSMRLIAACWETSYVVLSCPDRSDVLLSFGVDDFGNLGVGPSSAKPNPTQHRVHVVDLRRALDTSPSTSITTVLSLSTGPHHVLAQIRVCEPSGSSVTYLVGWGASRHGQLGPILDPSGRPRPTCRSPILIPSAAPFASSASFALGTQHTAYLRASGELVGLGSNRKGQLEGLAAPADVAQVACTWNGTYALLRNGRVLATGSNTHSQLGRGPAPVPAPAVGSGLEPVAFPFDTETRRVTRLVCGSEHVLCLVDVSVSTSSVEGEERKEREVWGWGWNEHGNLGIGGTRDSNVPVRIWPPLDANANANARAHVDGDDTAHSQAGGGDVLDVWAGCGTSWILIQK
ncbi:hypothetical protein V8D89_006370 [Ganoderma adspersum]